MRCRSSRRQHEDLSARRPAFVSPSFSDVMTEYMEDVLQPRSRHSWDVLKAWFSNAGQSSRVTRSTNDASAAETADADHKNPSDSAERNLEKEEDGAASTPSSSRPPSDAGTFKCNGDGGGFIWKMAECKIDDDGSCGHCQETLRSIDLSEDDEKRLLKQVRLHAEESCSNACRRQDRH